MALNRHTFNRLRKIPIPDFARWDANLPFVNGSRLDGTPLQNNLAMLTPQAAWLWHWRHRKWTIRGDAGSIRMFVIGPNVDKAIVCEAFTYTFPTGRFDDAPADERGLLDYDWSTGTIANDPDARISFIKRGKDWGSEEGESLEIIPLFSFGSRWNWDQFERGLSHWAKPELVTDCTLSIPWEEITIESPLGTDITSYFTFGVPGEPLSANLTAESSQWPPGNIGMTMSCDLVPAYTIPDDQEAYWGWDGRYDERTGARVIAGPA